MIGETKTDAEFPDRDEQNRSGEPERIEDGERSRDSPETDASEDQASLGRGDAMVIGSTRPLTAAAPLARSGKREPVSVEEVVVGVERLRLVDELLLLGRQSRS